jgi:hypothetical protein
VPAQGQGCPDGLWCFSGFRNRKSPRPTTGVLRVRDRFDTVEIPLNRMNQSKNARQKLLRSAKAGNSVQP